MWEESFHLLPFLYPHRVQVCFSKELSVLSGHGEFFKTLFKVSLCLRILL